MVDDRRRKEQVCSAAVRGEGPRPFVTSSALHGCGHDGAVRSDRRERSPRAAPPSTRPGALSGAASGRIGTFTACGRRSRSGRAAPPARIADAGRRHSQRRATRRSARRGCTVEDGRFAGWFGQPGGPGSESAPGRTAGDVVDASWGGVPPADRAWRRSAAWTPSRTARSIRARGGVRSRVAARTSERPGPDGAVHRGRGDELAAPRSWRRRRCGTRWTTNVTGRPVSFTSPKRGRARWPATAGKLPRMLDRVRAGEVFRLRSSRCGHRAPFTGESRSDTRAWPICSRSSTGATFGARGDETPSSRRGGGLRFGSPHHAGERPFGLALRLREPSAASRTANMPARSSRRSRPRSRGRA